MAILNYTTGIKSEQTIGEITALLVRKGARTISGEYDPASGRCTSLTFSMIVNGATVNFQLPANAEGVTRVMTKGKKATPAQDLQGEKVAWRIVKDWVEAQMALIESAQGELAQVFMPYALVPDGRTMYQLFLEGTQKKLGSGKGTA